jgi:hypothetical protein
VFPLRDHDYELVRASCRVGSASAGDYLQAAIFQYTPERELSQVPGTLVQFPTDATGILNVNLDFVVRLYAGQRYFFGFWCSSVTPRFSGYVTAANSFVERPLYKATPSLVDRVHTSDLLAASGSFATCPAVVYFSQDADLIS